MRDHSRVHASFWTSRTIRALDSEARLLALYLLTCPYGTIAGVFHLPTEEACDQLGWTPDQLDAAMERVRLVKFAKRCPVTGWVWVKLFLKWNQPANPNQWVSVRKACGQIPDACTWLPQFRSAIGPLVHMEPGSYPPASPHEEVILSTVRNAAGTVESSNSSAQPSKSRRKVLTPEAEVNTFNRSPSSIEGEFCNSETTKHPNTNSLGGKQEPLHSHIPFLRNGTPEASEADGQPIGLGPLVNGVEATIIDSPGGSGHQQEKTPTAPTDRDRVFQLGVPHLVQHGHAEKHARSALGLLVREHKDGPVAEALDEAIRLGAGEPLAYMRKTLKSWAKGRVTGTGNQQEQLEEQNRDVVARILKGGNHET